MVDFSKANASPAIAHLLIQVGDTRAECTIAAKEMFVMLLPVFLVRAADFSPRGVSESGAVSDITKSARKNQFR